MARDSSGTYSLPAGNPVTSGTTIEASWANATLPDIGTALTNSLDRTGKGSMTAPFKSVDGSVAAPGIVFSSETTTGFYRAGSADLRVSLTGVEYGQWTAGALRVKSADAGATYGPSLNLWRDSASPAASDVLGAVRFTGEDSGSNITEYARIQATLVDPTDTSEDGSLKIQTMRAGTLTDAVTIDESGNMTVSGTINGGVASFTTSLAVGAGSPTIDGILDSGDVFADSDTKLMTAAAIDDRITASSGTVTSVAATVPTGFAISGSPVTTTGTLAIAFDTGYSLPTDAQQTAWLESGDTAASLTITSADINGGTIDGTAVGASSASTGAFTTLSTTGSATFGAEITETVFAVTGTTPALDPTNGTIQTWTLSGASTPTYAAGWSAGESVTIMINAGANGITWPTTSWVGGSAPSLDATDETIIELWKVGSTYYGALVGIA